MILTPFEIEISAELWAAAFFVAVLIGAFA